jgi:hypothetical protein
MKVSNNSGTHWYDSSGKLIKEVHDSTGTKLIPPDVRHARKLKLYPSVTGITRLFPKENLASWINGKFILAARTQPWPPEMSEDEFIKSVTESAYEESNEAADVGSKIHDAIRDYLLKTDGCDDNIKILLVPVFLWINQNVIEVIHVEHSFCNTVLGFAGQIDCVCILKDGRHAILDWKTQSKEVSKLKPWPDWPLQLCAYSRGIGKPEAALINVVVSTKEPGILVKEWDEKDKYPTIFNALQTIWVYKNNYDPRNMK